MDKSVKKNLRLSAIVAAAVIGAALVAFLAVSLATGKWDKAWLIAAGGVSVAAIAVCAIALPPFMKNGRYTVPRIAVAITIVLAFLLVFLCIFILTDVIKTWIMFLIMAIAVLGSDTVFAYWVNCPRRLINLLIFIPVAFTLEYIVLALVELIPWHPWWVLIVAGVVIDIAIVLGKTFGKKKKAEDTTENVKDAGDKIE